MLLPRCYIDVDNCTKFINALRHYHRKYKEKDRLYSAKPNHDWSSHFNDALRTLATGLENEKFNNIRIRQTEYDKGFKYEFFNAKSFNTPPPKLEMPDPEKVPNLEDEARRDQEAEDMRRRKEIEKVEDLLF